MSRRGAVTAAVLACAALALAIVIVGKLSARSGAAPAVLASNAAPAVPQTQPPPAASTPACAAGTVTGSESALWLTGACSGELTGAFGCVAAVDDLYLTGRRQMDTTHVLYLTINVESYRQHPGDYGGAQAVLQMTGPVSVERWSNYAVNVHVNADRSVRVAPAPLAPDPGTGSAGTVTMSGSIGCGQ